MDMAGLINWGPVFRRNKIMEEESEVKSLFSGCLLRRWISYFYFSLFHFFYETLIVRSNLCSIFIFLWHAKAFFLITCQSFSKCFGLWMYNLFREHPHSGQSLLLGLSLQMLVPCLCKAWNQWITSQM